MSRCLDDASLTFSGWNCSVVIVIFLPTRLPTLTKKSCCTAGSTADTGSAFRHQILFVEAQRFKWVIEQRSEKLLNAMSVTSVLLSQL